MSMHGHRGPGELDYIAQTWSDHPELLVHTVKVCIDSIQLTIWNAFIRYYGVIRMQWIFTNYLEGMVATPSALKKGEAHAEIDSVLDSLRSVKVTGAKRYGRKDRATITISTPDGSWRWSYVSLIEQSVWGKNARWSLISGVWPFNRFVQNLLVKGSAHMRANIAALGTQLVDQVLSLIFIYWCRSVLIVL